MIFFQESLAFIVIKLRIDQSEYALYVLLIHKLSHQISLLLWHMDVVCTKFNVDSSKLSWSYPASESVPALEDYVRNSFLGECSGGSNAWNSCTDDDDLLDLLHVRYKILWYGVMRYIFNSAIKISWLLLFS